MEGHEITGKWDGIGGVSVDEIRSGRIRVMGCSECYITEKRILVSAYRVIIYKIYGRISEKIS